VLIRYVHYEYLQSFDDYLDLVSYLIRRRILFRISHEHHQREYGVELNKKPGRDNHQMIEGIHNGEINSLYLFRISHEHHHQLLFDNL
jgi:hypothetical protein